MKKIISLHVIVAMSLAIGSASLIEAYGNTNKYAQRAVKKGKRAAQESSVTMHSIERDLHSIQREFKDNGDVDAANARLDRIPAQIEQVVADMQDTEEHGKMWEVHEHTLNRKLGEVRKHVNRDSHESAPKATRKSKPAAPKKSVKSKSTKEDKLAAPEKSVKSKSAKRSKARVQEDRNVTMKSIEHDLYVVRRDFKDNGDVDAANARLDIVPAQIEQVVAEMQASEKHGKMWETHEHTLNRKLREVRELVNKQ